MIRHGTSTPSGTVHQGRDPRTQPPSVTAAAKVLGVANDLRDFTAYFRIKVG